MDFLAPLGRPTRDDLFSFSNKTSKTTKTIAVREDCAGELYIRASLHSENIFLMFSSFVNPRMHNSGNRRLLRGWSRRGVVKNYARC